MPRVRRHRQLWESLAADQLSDKVWPKIEAAIISHVSNETASFTPRHVVSQASFDEFLNLFFPEPGLAGVRTAINSTYNVSPL
jgi:hypothetical protein